MAPFRAYMGGGQYHTVTSGATGMSLSESREAIARMEATIQALQSQVTDLRLQVRENAADRYSQADADRDLSRVTKEVADNRRRIERLEHP